MAIPHTREPSRFNDSDYGEFCDVLEQFLSSPSSLPHRPEHLVAQQQTLGQAYQNKLDEYRHSREDSGAATTTMDSAAEALADKMRWLKFALPTLTPGSDAILEPFGLDKDIPLAQAELKDYADVVWAHWQDVSNEPLFAPLKQKIDTVGGAITAFQSAIDTQIAAQDKMYRLQNEKDDARNAHNDLERDIFKWYRIYYKDPKDHYWEQTPWGIATGKKLPAPKNFAFDKIAGMFSWDIVADADEYEVQYSEHGESEDWTTLYKGAANETNNKPSAPDVYDFRVRAIKGNNEGKWSKTLVVNIEFPAPGMLMYDMFRNDFSWQFVPGATKYELEILNITTQETTTIETPNNQKRLELAKGDYSVKVRAVKEASDPIYSPWSSDVLFIIKPMPGQFKYNPGLKELSWDSVAGANTYEVRKEGSFGFEYLGPDTEFILDLPAGQYKFRVRGGDDMANWWSAWSEELVVDV